MNLITRHLLPFFLLLLAGCATLNEPLRKPEVSLAGLRILELGLFEQRLELRLRVNNPNNFSIPLDGLQARLSLNGKQLAAGVSNQRVTLPRLSDTLVTVAVTTDLAGSLKVLQGALKSRGPLRYQAAGTLFLPLLPGGLEFSREGELPGLELPGEQ